MRPEQYQYTRQCPALTESVPPFDCSDLGEAPDLRTSAEPITNANSLQSAETFDLDSFFSRAMGIEDTDLFSENDEDLENPEDNAVAVMAEESKESSLLQTLQNDASESIATVSTRITADTFAVGSAMTTSVFSALGSLVGSCGVFCAHGLSSIAQAGTSGLSLSTPALGGVKMPGFSVDRFGNFSLEGDIDSLSQATGLSKNDLLAGKFSAEQILFSFFEAFGQGISMLFGFGLLDCIMDSLFPEAG